MANHKYTLKEIIGHLKQGKYRDLSDVELNVNIEDINMPELLSEYAKLLYEEKKYDQCLNTLEKITLLTNEETTYDIYERMGDVCDKKVKVVQAIENYKRALDINNKQRTIYIKLGNLYRKLSDFDNTIKYYQIALQMHPNILLHSRILMAMHYLVPYNREKIFAEHKKWAELYGKKNFNKGKRVERSTEKIRIGLISGDFFRHSISFFLLPLIENIDKEEFEIYCYANSTHSDDITALIKYHAKEYRIIKNIVDKEVYQCIIDDEIDILIDLAGHTSRGRPGLLAYKPAPVQITYLGYPDTTGIESVDYRIVDKFTDNDIDGQIYNTEKLLYMPNCFLCFRSLDNDSIYPSTLLPYKKNQFITFGSFNATIKYNDKVIYTWAQILNTFPKSKLILKATNIRYKAYQENILSMFKKNGFSEIERIEFLGRTATYESHLKCYDNIDIALDPFPYNGATTTCQALSMGVPVVVLKGKAHVSRVSYSILNNLGYCSLVADSIEEYIAIAINLAGDIEQIDHYRHNLRQMMNKRISDQKRFSKDFSSLLKGIAKT